MKTFDPNYKLLDEMYQDNYYPTFLVDKVKDELQKVIDLLESGETDTEVVQETLDEAVCGINDLQEEFDEHDSEIEMCIRDSCDIIRYKTTLRTNGAAMNKYIGQQFAALRYEKNILVVEETTSAGGCGSFNAASSCPASACLYDSAAWGFFIA